MEKKIKSLLITFIVFALLLPVIVSGIAYLILMLPVTQRRILDFAEDQVEKVLVADCKIGLISTNFLTHVSIKNISLRDPDGHGDSIVIGSVQAQFRILSLLQKKIDIPSVLIDKIDALLTVAPNGRLMIPALPDSLFIESIMDQSKSIPPEPTEWSLNIGIARAINVNAVYSDSMHKFVGKIQNATAEANIFRYDSMHYRLAVPDGSYESPWWTGAIDTIGSSAILNSHGMVFKDIFVNGASTNITGSGEIPFSTKGHWDLSALVHSNMEPVKAIYDNVPFLTNDGEVSAEASWKGTIDHPVLEFRGTGSDWNTTSFAVPSLYIQGRYDGDSLLSIHGAFVTDIGRVACSAMVSMPALFVRPQFNEYRSGGSVNGINLSRIGIPDSLQKYVFWSNGNASFSANGTGVEQLPDSVIAHLELKHPDSSTRNAYIDAEYSLGKWSFGGTWGHDTFSGRGLLGEKWMLSGRVNGDFNDVTDLSTLFFGEHIEGNIGFSSSLNGSIYSPEISMTLSSNKLSWRSMIADSLLVNLNFINKQVRLDPSFVSMRTDIDSVLSYWGVHDLKGTMALDAMISGDITQPDISAIVSVNNFVSSSMEADSLNAVLTVTDLDSIDVKQFNIYKNDAGLSGGGAVSIKSKMFTIDVVPSTGNRKMWLNKGALHADGTIINDSLHGRITGENIDIASINEWIPISDSLAGICNVQAAIDGPLYNPEGYLDISVVSPKYNEMSIQEIKGRFNLEDSIVSGSMSIDVSEISKNVTLDINIPLLFDSTYRIDRSDGRSGKVSLSGNDISAMELIKFFGSSWNSDGALQCDIDLESKNNEWVLNGAVIFQSSQITNKNEDIRFDSSYALGKISGTLKNPRIEYLVTTNKTSFKGSSIDSAFLKGSLSTDTLKCDSARITFPNKGFVDISGTLPLDKVDSLLLQPGLAVNFNITKFPLRLFAPLFFENENMITSGFAHGGGNIRINSGRPVLNGKIFIDSAIIALEDIEPVIGPTTAMIKMRDDSLVFESIQGDWGNGSLKGKGAIVWSTKGIAAADFNVSGKDLKIEMTDVFSVIIPDANATITKENNKFNIKGDIDLDGTRYFRDIRITDLVGDIGSGGYTEIKNDTLLENINLQLKLKFLENPIVDMNLGYFELGGDVTITGNVATPIYVGAISVIDGYVIYLDRHFEVIDGSFINYNQQILNPAINIKAQTEVFATSSGTDNVDNFTIYLGVSGTLENPQVTLSDQSGALNEADIISILTLGQRLGSVGDDLGDRLRAFAGQSILGFGTRKLEQILKMDRIDIQGDVFKIGSKNSPTLTMSKRILPRLTVTYETALADLTQRKFTALFRLTKRMFIKGNANTDDYGLDLILKYSK